MKKIIICDQNRELIDFLKANIKEGMQPSGVELQIVHGDVIEMHENTDNSRIVTASNPQFSPDGGLDYALSKKYSWAEASEFQWNEDLFYVVSVDEQRKSNKGAILRALAGVLGYAHEFVPIITGIGTAIGGLPMQDLLDGITQVLSYANLSYANLSYANLSYANLSYANLRYADLSYANLSYANLSYANLSYADLRSADLRSADLRSADLRSANLRYANLRSAKNTDAALYNEYTAFFAIQCPEEGAFVAWKKASGYIVKLEIPARAKRSSATSRKCRASQAKVLAIYNSSGEEMKECKSSYDDSFTYKVGRIVKPSEKFDTDRWNECSTGIHFFITRKEAEQY